MQEGEEVGGACQRGRRWAGPAGGVEVGGAAGWGEGGLVWTHLAYRFFGNWVPILCWSVSLRRNVVQGSFPLDPLLRVPGPQ